MRPVLNRSFLSFFLIMGSLCLVSWVFEGAAQKTSDTESAEALLQAGKLTEAKQAVTTELRKRPVSVKQLILLTRILLIEDEFDEAKTQIQQALKLAPANPEALALYGHSLFREGSFALAETQYQKSLRLDSKQAGAHLGLGRIYLTRQQPEQSVKSFQQAIHLAPEEEDNYFFASEAYGATKDFAKQVESLEKYLALKPKFNAERVENAKALLTFFRHLEDGPVAAIADAERPYEIPFQPFFGLMLVEGHVNGQGPFRFLVDSGATSTVLSNEPLRLAEDFRSVDRRCELRGRNRKDRNKAGKSGKTQSRRAGNQQSPDFLIRQLDLCRTHRRRSQYRGFGRLLDHA